MGLVRLHDASDRPLSADGEPCGTVLQLVEPLRPFLRRRASPGGDHQPPGPHARGSPAGSEWWPEKGESQPSARIWRSDCPGSQGGQQPAPLHDGHCGAMDDRAAMVLAVNASFAPLAWRKMAIGGSSRREIAAQRMKIAPLHSHRSNRTEWPANPTIQLCPFYVFRLIAPAPDGS